MLIRAGRFLWQFVQMLGVRGFAMALSFVMAVFLAQVLGPEDYGIYAFTMAVFMVLEPLSGGGLGTLGTRELAGHEGPQDEKARLIGQFMLAGLALSVCTALCVLAFAWGFGPANSAYLALAIVYLPAAVLVETSRGVLAGQGKVKLAQFLSQVFKPGLFLVIGVGLFWGLGLAATAYASLILMALCTLCAAILALRMSPVSMRFSMEASLDISRITSLLRASVPFAIITAMQYFNTRIDVMMIGNLMENTDVGQYQVATRLSHLVSVPASLVALMMAPRFATMHRKGQQLRRPYMLAQIPAAGASTLVFAFLALAGSWFISITFGLAYAAAAAPMFILIFAQLLFSLRALSNMLMSMVHLERRLIMVLLIGMAGNIGLNTVLIPRFGLEGAASATSLIGVITFIILHITLWRSGILRKSGP